MGAVAIKNSVYVAPRMVETQEDFEWLVREIVKGGGDASICEARFIEGLDDDHVEALFNAARESDYRQIADDARAVTEHGPYEDGQGDAEIARLRRRLDGIISIDFFQAPGREGAEGLVSELERHVRAEAVSAPNGMRLGELRGR